MQAEKFHSLPIGVLLTIVFSALITGCGEASYPVVPVSGTITDASGAPLGNVAVVFHPVPDSEVPFPGPTSGAYTDATGKYELKEHINDDRGAVPGKYIVKIWPSVDNSESDEIIEDVLKIPAIYNDESTLKFEVPPEGTDSADFSIDLKAKS